MTQFRCECDQIDVTSLHRPAVGWVFVDAAGHSHEWWAVGAAAPATSYDPRQAYDVPTLVLVKDGEEFWEDDDEPHDVGHLECRQCGERVEPAYTADTYQQFVPGLKHYYIDDRPVSEAEFKAALAQQGKGPSLK